MAETETGQERTEQATPKRRQEARRKGQIPRSRELNTLAMTLSSAVALVVMGDYLMAHFGDLLRQGLTLDRRLIFDPHGALEALGRALVAGLVMLVPFFALNLVVAVLSSISLGGWSFSTEALAPKLSKMSPIKGLKRMFALRGLMELGKALAKFLLVGAVGTALLWHYAGEMLALGYQSVDQALAHSGDILAWSFVFLSLTLVIVAADPPVAARDGPAPHDGGSARGRRGHHQPDPLCGGAQVRPGQDARAAGGGQGRRPGRSPHPRAGHGARGAHLLGAAARPRPLSQH